MSLTIIIPTYNRPIQVQDAIASVRRAEGGAEVPIIVVDDASNIPLPPLEGAGIQILTLPQNSGPGVAKNVALAQVKTRWAAVLDDDDTFVADGIAALLAATSGESNDEYPVLQFARSDGRVPAPRALIGLRDMIEGKVGGEFCPVINVALFKRRGYRFPELRAGAESLLWWQIARDGPIPHYAKVVQLLGTRAPSRMTSLKSRLKWSASFAEVYRQRLALFGEEIKQVSRKKHRLLQIKRVAYWLIGSLRRDRGHR